MTIKKPDANPILALLLTWFLFGSGHFIVNGQQKKWIMTLVGGILGSILCCLPGMLIGILSIVDAYKTAQKLQSGREIGEHEYSIELLYKIMKYIYKDATFAP
ncbi:MAG TPA: hypothetical protein VHQ47_09035 [Phycisphaerae bacterium]|jgi:hypothetical protein|nr:hypothetical protein [Phycisphaerae bacterium]HWB99564.1 hypothetical protein [Bryobacteraceae bacterium]